MKVSYYRHHVFFCTNLRPDGSQCCQQCGAQEARDYVKQRVKELGSAIPDKVRINNAGCLDRCAEGPVIVIYPEATWYTYVDHTDLDEIISEHLINGRPVDRLRI
ncbi:MAG: (2Fe-2S) ferredoxin domain-containing protein [Synechococcaceae cyanobacterium SM1_2_3]|nr:(2Fe-2S) ferredoxin domain-containing protein [Synechococcaceae cyanobacterium SM1_2_3]